MREIDAKAKTVSALLNRASYTIDYYQRDYRWERKHVQELIDDLTDAFRANPDASSTRHRVGVEGAYYVGSIIVTERDGQRFIVDGQQRLTTITLLLIHLRRLLSGVDDELRSDIDPLIRSRKSRDTGSYTFNIDIDDRRHCMTALYDGHQFDPSDDSSRSVHMLSERFDDILELLPDDIVRDSLAPFAEWLLDRVYFVEITAFSDDDAYTIFETMNDRGLRLTPTDMLKSYLLRNISDEDRRTSADTVWKQRIAKLSELGTEEDADAIKAWLRARHADDIQQSGQDNVPRDFEQIGSGFHRWVRDKHSALGLNESEDYARFIHTDFQFFTHAFERLRNAARSWDHELPEVRYLGDHNFTLQYPVTLASLSPDDPQATVDRKLAVVGAFLDIMVHRRLWNFRAIDQRTMRRSMFRIVSEIRRCDLDDLVSKLEEHLDSEDERFDTQRRFRMHGTNRPVVRRILARLTAHLEEIAHDTNPYPELVNTSKGGYDIEHIWADNFVRDGSEFDHSQDFAEARNSIGGLLLLPKSFNRSYRDSEYATKRDYYREHNFLAASLHEACYEQNPGMKKIREKTGLDFQAHSSFRNADLVQRQQLYVDLAEEVWHPRRLRERATQ